MGEEILTKTGEKRDFFSTYFKIRVTGEVRRLFDFGLEKVFSKILRILIDD